MKRFLVAGCCFFAACGGSSSSEEGNAGDAAIDSATFDSATPGSDTLETDSAPAIDATDTAPATESGGPQPCIPSPATGTNVLSCDGIAYDVTVPGACLAGGCGIVLDVHGLSMSGKMEDNNTNLRALGGKYGYVIVQPNANPAPPASSWTPGADDDKIFAFLKQAIAAYGIDAKKVHMTGFSQGGMMTSRMLCKHADVWASVAPGAGTGCTFVGSDVPSREVPMLYLHGTADALVAFSVGKAQVDAAVAYWKMTPQADVESDTKHAWHRWKSASGTVLEFVQHDYQASSLVLRGHCFPGSKDLKGGELGQLFGFACTDTSAFTWGDIVMKFFVDHPKS